MHQGELAKHKYPQFQKLQEFALGTGVMFHILFKSDENNAQEIIFFMNMFHMSLSLETKRFRRETWCFKKSLLTKIMKFANFKKGGIGIHWNTLRPVWKIL